MDKGPKANHITPYTTKTEGSFPALNPTGEIYPKDILNPDI